MLTQEQRPVLKVASPPSQWRQRLRQWRQRLATPGLIDQYLRTHSVRKLQIGAGRNLLPGWLNTDYAVGDRGIAFLNACQPFPFEDGTFDHIFSEHLIEHLAYLDGRRMLGECFRVLKPGGRVRISTPNLEFLVALYQGEKSSLQRRYITWSVDRFQPEIGIHLDTFVINNFFRDWGHQFIYDYPALQAELERIGFVDVKRCQVGESEDEHLRGLESHGRRIPEEFNRMETFVIEGIKPV